MNKSDKKSSKIENLNNTREEMPSAKGPTKLFHARTTSSLQSIISLTRTPLVQIICLLIGLIGFIVFFASLNCTPKAQTRSVSVFWDRGDIVDGTHQGSLFIGDGERSKVMGFVGIFTGFASLGRRKVLRQTWLPSDPTSLQRLEESTGLAFRFIIGRSKEERKMSVLKKEIDRYDDFILLDVEEQYSKLPYKTLAFFKAAYALYDADFYVKADDDIYLRPDRLSLLLAKERSHPQTYLGCMKKGPVFTDPRLKWYEPLSHLHGTEYFLHAYGPLYALSAKVVRSLVALRNDSFRMFSNEDVTIGSWMLAMNVNHENNHELCSPQCTSTSIAVWDIPRCSGLCNPEQRMPELHKMEECTGNAATTEADE